jgi:hypothetical protein
MASAESTQAITAVASADPVVMTIDGEPVSAGEFKLVMEGHISNVAGYFYGKGIEDHQGYWKDSAAEESPIRMLRKVVTDDLKRIKTIQGWAKQKGLIADISFAAYEDHFRSENERRAQALARGDVIYGPKQYQPYRYYFFRLRDLDQALLEKLAKEPAYTVPDADIETFYKENKETFGDRSLEDAKAQIRSMYQKKKYAAELKERIASAKVEVNQDALFALAPRHDE